jgi:hypothetical protein
MILALIAVLSVSANVPIYFMLRSPHHALIRRLHVPEVIAPVTLFTHDDWRGYF